MTESELESHKMKLYEKMCLSGWGAPLKGFLLSEDFGRIIRYLDKESTEGRHWTPKFKQVFRAFFECPYDKLKVVTMGQDPYPHMNKEGKTICDGLAFSVSNTMWAQPSLSYIHGNIADTVYPGQEYIGPLDLKVWAQQGVLLINVALTTTVGKVGTHYDIWKEFIDYLLDHINWKRSEVVFGLFGKIAVGRVKSLGGHVTKFSCTHPAFAAYQKTAKWDSGDIWNKINKQLIRQGSTEIIW